MKIYTKTGDKGTTALIGGKRVQKHHERIEAYGTVDELMAFVALLRDSSADEHVKATLLIILDKLMVSASILAADCDDCLDDLPKLRKEDILLLEGEIDKMEQVLPPLSSFVLPGGDMIISHCHVARNVCRRAERIIIKLNQSVEIPPVVIEYFNRLSDYFFVLARKFTKDLNVEEIPWKPKL